MIECMCPSLRKAFSEGMDKMEKEKAPWFIVEAYKEDMLNGDWVGCYNCPKRKQIKERK